MNITDLDNNLKTIHEWIHSADQKASIYLALVFGAFAVGGDNYWPYIAGRLSDAPLLVVLAFVISFSILAWSIIKSLLIIRPSLSNNGRSITYFGHISQLDLKAYRKLVSKTSTQDYWSEVTEQINTTSKIARKKHTELSEAILLFMIHAISLGITIGMSYVA